MAIGLSLSCCLLLCTCRISGKAVAPEIMWRYFLLIGWSSLVPVSEAGVINQTNGSSWVSHRAGDLLSQHHGRQAAFHEPIWKVRSSSNFDLVLRPQRSASHASSNLVNMEKPPLVSKPYFEMAWPRNITVAVGQTVVLKCRVRLLGDRTVSWIRQRDLHVLTSGLVSYTSDARFAVYHRPMSDDWELHITSAQPRDSGLYEVQVNTEPKMHWPMHLLVHTAAAQIAGPAEVYVRQGSALSLSCSLQGPLPSFGTLTWYHDGIPIVLESSKSSISLATERNEEHLSSRLLLPRASAEDGGNYTCLPSQAQSASVLVHVLNGEHPAAMQHGNRSGGATTVTYGKSKETLSILTAVCVYWIAQHSRQIINR